MAATVHNITPMNNGAKFSKFIKDEILFNQAKTNGLETITRVTEISEI